MIRNIVFDMGKVLLEYEPLMPCLRHTQGRRDEAHKLCRAIFESPEWIMLDKGVITERELERAAQAALSEPELKALVSPIINDWHLDTLWPIKGIDGVIERLLKRGYPLYILSNASLRFRAFQYKIPHVEDFSGILVSAEEKLLKPDTAIFHRLCQKFELNPAECLFIDDNKANVEGAEQTGMKGYCFADGDVKRLSAVLEQL